MMTPKESKFQSQHLFAMASRWADDGEALMKTDPQQAAELFGRASNLVEQALSQHPLPIEFTIYTKLDNGTSDRTVHPEAITPELWAARGPLVNFRDMVILNRLIAQYSESIREDDPSLLEQTLKGITWINQALKLDAWTQADDPIVKRADLMMRVLI